MAPAVGKALCRVDSLDLSRQRLHKASSAGPAERDGKAQAQGAAAGASSAADAHHAPKISRVDSLDLTRMRLPHCRSTNPRKSRLSRCSTAMDDAPEEDAKASRPRSGGPMASLRSLFVRA